MNRVTTHEMTIVCAAVLVSLLLVGADGCADDCDDAIRVLDVAQIAVDAASDAVDSLCSDIVPPSEKCVKARERHAKVEVALIMAKQIVGFLCPSLPSPALSAEERAMLGHGVTQITTEAEARRELRKLKAEFQR